MNRFLTKVLFPKLILFFSGLQHRTEGESHSTSFFSAILMQVWKICNFFFAIQTAETRQCACVLFSLYICILSYDEYTNHSKAPEKKKKKNDFFPHSSILVWYSKIEDGCCYPDWTYALACRHMRCKHVPTSFFPQILPKDTPFLDCFLHGINWMESLNKSEGR